MNENDANLKELVKIVINLKNGILLFRNTLTEACMYKFK